MLIVVFERLYFYQTLVKSRGEISENFRNIGERLNGVYFANPC